MKVALHDVNGSPTNNTFLTYFTCSNSPKLELTELFNSFGLCFKSILEC